ncbi:Aldehyde/histidinol dehydrogenase [Kickxella alabastrina]|uniref:Aldehyde/histidinol dehydrogenase n=1 Tax=Kickxella alabastrina TaxID=61397 RepID=UPI00221E5226|nr:Aldehyde/histidinol dehydrogenase [Kickxella alabastrina]KAI7830869.1 Aldehyde/histidinol dehydrogenase [Kickxella alabastrina]
MDCLRQHLSQCDSLPIVIAVIAGSAVLYILFFRNRSLPAIRFELKPPAESLPGWRANEILDEPSIFIKDRQAPVTTPDELSDKLQRARSAQATWSLTTFEQRRQVLRTLNDFIISHQREICQVACRDSGKTMIDATLGENGEQALMDDKRDPGFMMMYKRARVVYQPRGVVSALVSWNYPFHNTIGPVISAIFSGNGIVIKASEHVAWSMSYWEQIVKRALNVCGHNPDLVQFVTEVGKLVMKSASSNLTPVTLELGGKDCAIVFADSDMSQCIPVLMRGVIQNASQNCIGIERILVQDAAYDNFVSEMTRRIKAVRLGAILDDQPNQVDCGAMILSNSFGRLESLIADAVSKGARCLAGGHPYIHPLHPKGQYFEPTLLVDVTPDMDITRNETFGPIMVIMKFSDEQDVLNKVHSSPYGLGSSVFSGNQARASRIALKLRVGMTNVNDFGVNYICQSLPFGGGFGRFAGPEGLRALCVEKAFTEDRFSFIKTPIPPIVDYPIQDTEKGFKFTQQIVAFAYSDSWWASIKAGLNLGKLSM